MKYFGTDGIRQKADQFTPEFLGQIVIGLYNYASKQNPDFKVLLGGDTRESTEWLIQDLATALESLGIEYASVGILPTPAINYFFFAAGFDFAIDVTASHNPYIDNGIKIFERGKNSGVKLCEEGCEAIEKAISDNLTYTPVATTDRESLHDEAVESYTAHLINYIGEDTNFSGLNIGIDCANGAMSAISDTVFTKLGATTTLINVSKDYTQKINADCGSTHLESLIDLVTKNHLDFGIAFDGDGDRVLMVDNLGHVIDGDDIIAILANFLQLDRIAVTVMANQGLLNWAKSAGVEVEITPVGDSNVAAAMREKNIQLGGEQSGHIILPNETTGDGMLTALMITKVVATSKKSLDSLASIITKSPQITINFTANKSQKSALKTPASEKLLLEYHEKLSTLDGRLLVRPSGTEDLIRITAWGNDETKITALVTELKAKLQETL